MRTMLRVSKAVLGISLLTAPAAAQSVVGCAFPYVTSGILAPTNADGSSVFEIKRTVPLKIRVSDCNTLAAANDLTPVVTLMALGDDGTPVQVNQVVSSSAADDGTTMRHAGNGQYIYNLSCKNSQFNAGQDLVPGLYELRILGNGQFEDVVVRFRLRN